MGLGFSTLGALYALLLLLVIIRPSRGVSAIFRWKPLMGLGTIAYAVYLFHPAISYLIHDAVLRRFPAFDELHSFATTGLAAATSVSLAMLSWEAMEGPLTRWAHRRFRYSLVPRNATQVLP
jgi:peptidoglycan/LPS O-acetylase OafA/YrhL